MVEVRACNLRNGSLESERGQHGANLRILEIEKSQVEHGVFGRDVEYGVVEVNKSRPASWRRLALHVRLAVHDGAYDTRVELASGMWQRREPGSGDGDDGPALNGAGGRKDGRDAREVVSHGRHAERREQKDVKDEHEGALECLRSRHDESAE